MQDDLIKTILVASSKSIYQNLIDLNTSLKGLSSKEASIRLSSEAINGTGRNNQNESIFHCFIHAYINPFSIVLLIIIVISFFTDVILDNPNSRNSWIFLIMLIMFILSGVVRFIQEMHSKHVFEDLMNLIDVDVKTMRDEKWETIPAEKLVVGDLVALESGEQVPADIRLVKADHCIVSEAAITGESTTIFKTANSSLQSPSNLHDCQNIIFAKSNIVGGRCEGIILATGKKTFYGHTTDIVKHKRQAFDEGSNSIAWVLIRFMVMIVPIVFVVTGFAQDNWLTALLFAMSVSIGLTPELLPMVITSCLAKGSHSMGQKQTIVKNVNAMQAFGEMDTLCVDKTGTLTNEELHLEYYTDILGNENTMTLNYAYLNSYYRSGLANHIDNAILKTHTFPDNQYQALINHWHKISDAPFDYEKRFSSVTLKHDDEYLLIAKGDVKDILKHCQFVEYQGQKYPIGEDSYNDAHKIVDEMSEEGMKVIAVAINESSNIPTVSNMTLIGYIAFFNAPKESAAAAIRKLQDYNINIKVLTGDNFNTTKSICHRLNMNTDLIITGSQLNTLSEDEFQLSVEEHNIFVELTPNQKAKIIEYLKINGHHVGFLGDGLNDLPAFIEADVAISVDNALPAVKKTADVILLKKDLNVLENGVIEGRKAFANMSKYVKITSSSNLGNIISIIIASLLLPFLPMTSVQLLLLNLLYDILCLSLPWDNVDENQIAKPLEWSGNNLSKFMLFFGPISSLFDLVTFIFLFYYLCPNIFGMPFGSLTGDNQLYFIALFQTGWFLESMWSQVLILFSLRTNKLALAKSFPSKPMLVVTIVGIIVFTLTVMTPLGAIIGLARLPLSYFIFLLIVVTIYLLVVTYAKKYYIKHYGNLI